MSQCNNSPGAVESGDQLVGSIEAGSPLLCTHHHVNVTNLISHFICRDFCQSAACHSACKIIFANVTVWPLIRALLNTILSLWPGNETLLELRCHYSLVRVFSTTLRTRSKVFIVSNTWWCDVQMMTLLWALASCNTFFASGFWHFWLTFYLLENFKTEC